MKLPAKYPEEASTSETHVFFTQRRVQKKSASRNLLRVEQTLETIFADLEISLAFRSFYHNILKGILFLLPFFIFLAILVFEIRATVLRDGFQGGGEEIIAGCDYGHSELRKGWLYLIARL